MYEQARRNEIQQIPDFRDEDCFHNGHKVLPTVKQWHQLLKERLDPGDTITRKVLPMVEEMLMEETYRKDAGRFVKLSHDIIAQASEDLVKLLPSDSIDNDLLPPRMRGQRQRQRTEPPVVPYDSELPMRVSTAIQSNNDSFQGILSKTERNSPPLFQSPESENKSPFPCMRDSRYTAGQSSSPPRQYEYPLVQPVNGEKISSHSPPRAFDSYEIHSHSTRNQDHDSGFVNNNDQLPSNLEMAFGSDQIKNAPVDYSGRFSNNTSIPTRTFSEKVPRLLRDGRLPLHDNGTSNEPNYHQRPQLAFLDIADPSSAPVQGLFHAPSLTSSSINFGDSLNDVNLAQPATPMLVSPPSQPTTSLPLSLPSAASAPLLPARRTTVVPDMTIEEAIEWRELKKSKKMAFDPVLRDCWALNELEGRDSVCTIFSYNKIHPLT